MARARIALLVEGHGRVSRPLISVLMPTYNCRQTLAEAVDCILAQTLDDFELILVDDGSTDDSPDLIRRIAANDPRVRPVRQSNQGVGVALNTALEVARGKFLARMDADDLTPSDRFAEQVDFLEENPHMTVVGGWHRTFGGGESRVHEFPTDPGHLKAAMLFRDPISHPTVMMRRQDFLDHGWRYDTRRPFPEDYDLWVTIAEHRELANLPKVYLEYRIRPDSVCRGDWPLQQDQHVAVQCRLLDRLGLYPNHHQRAIHKALAFDQIASDARFIADAHAWLLEILAHNDAAPVFSDRGLRRVLTGRYIALVRAARLRALEIKGLDESPFKRLVRVPLP
jgi:glycosyltransferase involved in cell wall biosynthesis